jgi:serine/threonine protein kinase
LLAALNHAHIAAIYGLDDHEGTQYLAMELVEGETLEEKLKPGPLPVEDALRLALQIAEALEAAHEKGVVHRDLKPANIMVTANGQVKVLDFGLAKAFSGDPNEASPLHSPALSVAMTQQGLILGTAGYMSPEQASGQATDQRADIWAFGVVLYEMLTGLPLFSGARVAIDTMLANGYRCGLIKPVSLGLSGGSSNPMVACTTEMHEHREVCYEIDVGLDVQWRSAGVSFSELLDQLEISSVQSVGAFCGNPPSLPGEFVQERRAAEAMLAPKIVGLRDFL